MTVRCASSSLLQKSFYLAFLVILVTAEECDKIKCPGPLRYYKDLGCKPIYENPDDCCAIEYDCDHLKTRSKDKCYVNGHEYNIGEELREEDKNPCDFECKCRLLDDIPSFLCAGSDCALISGGPNCYHRFKPDQCCPGPLVCLEEGEERPTCEVDGKIYKDGEYFKPRSDPDLNCYCGPGYTGENVAPFCLKPKHSHCAADFRNAGAVYHNCAPVYHADDSPQTDCYLNNRCQNPNDVVIHNHDDSSSVDLEERTCKFGNLTLHLGDELNESDKYSKCLKCICEVPPVPTCQRLPADQCENPCIHSFLC